MESEDLLQIYHGRGVVEDRGIEAAIADLHRERERERDTRERRKSVSSFYRARYFKPVWRYYNTNNFKNVVNRGQNKVEN